MKAYIFVCEESFDYGVAVFRVDNENLSRARIAMREFLDKDGEGYWDNPVLVDTFPSDLEQPQVKVYATYRPG